MADIILLNKPFQVLCQFSPHEQKTTLKEYIPIKDFYPCGRLDYDSEGLLILSNDGALQTIIAHPKYKMPKTYWAQVEGLVESDAIQQLQKGIQLKDGKTKPAEARLIEEPGGLWARNPPIRDRKNIPTSWIELTIKEGKNRQVRRMTAAVGHPTLRLIRAQIGSWGLENLQPGEWRYGEIDEALLQKINQQKQTKQKRPTNARARRRRSP